MSVPILVDSSAWVEVLRNRAAPALRQSVEEALHEGRAALTAPVWVELYRGVRGKRELQQLNSLRSLCRWLDFDDDCWELAAQTVRECREHGAAVPLGDVLVFACGQRHAVEIIEHDQHFAQIAKATKI